MLSLGRFPAKLQYDAVLHSPITNYLHFPPKSHLPCPARLTSEAVILKARAGLCCRASKTKKKGGFTVEEVDGGDEFEGEDFDGEFSDSDEIEDEDGGGEFDGDGGGEFDDDEVVVPLKNMKKWLERRPRGFGEGKVYDTTIEDKLMEEIEQSRVAQIANVSKLKDDPIKSNSQKEASKKDKVPPPIVDGFRVRLVNLPKKKNIHKDLRVAFKGAAGVVNIVPLVSGNEKTRDPVCKGIAFVDFKNKNEAERFIQNFSGKPILFGKVEKEIKCEMMNPKLKKPESDRSVRRSNGPSLQPILNSDEEPVSASEFDKSLLFPSKESIPSELDDADEINDASEESEEDEDVISATSTTPDSDLADEPEEGKDSTIDASSLKQTKKVKKHPKKVASRKVKADAPKLYIPGSAKKLESREKAVLTGVFSKYGTAASTVKEKEQSR